MENTHKLTIMMSTASPEQVGQEMYQLAFDLYPICRSITGDGLRASLKILQQVIPLEIHEVPTGTQVFDWSVPREWNVEMPMPLTPMEKGHRLHTTICIY
jgi:aminopeptidase-like protein